MVSRGYAWHYRAHCKDPVLATLQSQARSGNRGLWATPHPTAPWDFRRQNRHRN
jgi:endonuclease YncB( thermonuclease family)